MVLFTSDRLKLRHSESYLDCELKIKALSIQVIQLTQQAIRDVYFVMYDILA